jgi:hypothetical protein
LDDLGVLNRRADGGTEGRGRGRSRGRRARGSSGRAVERSSYRCSRSRGRGSVLLLDNYLLAAVFVLGSGVGVRVGVVVAVTVDGVNDVIGDLVSSFGDTVAERMILSVFVVISHITLELLGFVNRGTSRLYSDLFPGRVTAVDGVNLTALRIAVVLGGIGLLAVAGGLFVAWVGVEVDVTLGNVTSYDGTSAFAELAFGNVNLGSTVLFRCRTVDSVELAVVGSSLDVEMAIDERATRWLKAVMRKEKVSWNREEEK